MVYSIQVDFNSLQAIPEQEHRTPRIETRMSEIVEKLKDRSSSADEIIRLICIEIAVAAKAIAEGEWKTSADLRILKGYSLKLKTLRALCQTVVLENKLQKAEVADIDAPRVQFLVEELFKCFRRAAEEALGRGCGDLVERIMRECRDIAGMEYGRIRREFSKA